MKGTVLSYELCNGLDFFNAKIKEIIKQWQEYLFHLFKSVREHEEFVLCQERNT